MAADLHDLVKRHGGVVRGSSALIPGPGHSRRDRSLSIRLGREDRLVFYSFAGDSIEAVRDYLGLEARQGEAPNPALYRKLKLERERERRRQDREQRRQDAQALEFCGAVWSQAGPCDRSPAETYLRKCRGISWALPNVLRFHPAAPLDYDAKHRAPAMVAIVQAPNGEPCGLHVTALKPDGSGKAGGNARRMFGPVKGGAIRLAPVADQLAVAEGVETALSFMVLTGTPTWSAMSTAGLEAFTVPPGVKQLTIAADGDEAGLKAARQLATTAQRHCDVILCPAPDGEDWNDALKGEV